VPDLGQVVVGRAMLDKDYHRIRSRRRQLVEKGVKTKAKIAFRHPTKLLGQASYIYIDVDIDRWIDISRPRALLQHSSKPIILFINHSKRLLLEIYLQTSTTPHFMNINYLGFLGTKCLSFKIP
jgi:hypothetical protein